MANKHSQALIIADEKGHKGTENLDQLLALGWTVIHTCPMPSSGGPYGPTCLVIVKAPSGYTPGDEQEPTPAQVQEQKEKDEKKQAKSKK